MTVMVEPPDAPPTPALQDAVMSNAVVEESADGPAPMAVVSAQSTPETKVESQQLDDPQTFRFTWKIEDFSKLKDRRYSDVFVVGQCKWQLLIELKENNPYLGLYLVVADVATLPPDWTRFALFDLAVVDQKDSSYTRKRVTHQTFSQRTPDWGFPNFMPLSIFHDQIRGYIVSDTSIIEATVRELVDHSTYDSKKETGYVGLKNQGATCYMNSLLQTLYHIPYFRKAVYHMPTTENDMPSGSIPLALQRLFYELQYHASTVATQELTTSFGWGSGDAFLQHDVQELNRVLCEKLENCMKGTVVEGTIQKLFEGHHMNYIECIDVDYRSTRKEAFYDLQLVVKDCEDVYASFDKYIEVEKLERDNKYQAERHGLQDARKGVLFLDFPPVLQLHLKRFEYDPIQDVMVKINDRYEFPLQLDLDRDGGKYLSPNADRHVRNLYTLHSVLVHSGGVHGGHYYAFIRPTLSDKWFKFDDERVTIEDAKKALEEQYGGFEELPQATPKVAKNSNAYMLFYIRESDLERIICKVDEQDIAQHVIVRWKKEQEERERKKKEEAEAHLYSTIKVVRDQDLAEQIGRELFIDLVDFDNVMSYRVPKETLFGNFKEEVAKNLGIPVEFLRFWLWAKRRNNTYCLSRPLSFDEESGTVGLLAKAPHEGNTAELKFFVEVELGKDSCPVSLPEKSEEDMLLFFKLYDPKKENLRYVGRLSVKATGRPVEILGKLREMAGFCENEEVELYAVDFLEPEGMCEDIDIDISFLSHQLKDGDIICYQKATPLEGNEQVHYPDVPAFLEYVLHREVIHFQSLEKPNEDAFSLTLSKLCSYDEVVEKVANHLGLDDPTKIRLTSHNHHSNKPKRQPIKYRGVETLEDMLLHHNQITNTLYYEVLDIPLPELESLKTLKFAFRRATKDEAVLHTVRLLKTSTVGDVINDLKTKVELSHPDAELRLLEVYSHRIYKVFQVSDKIENINDQYWTLRAEEIPEEEKEIGPNGRLIHVYHFTRDANQSPTTLQNFGEPFFFVIHKGETLAEIKIRMQKKLQTPEEEFAKWKVAFVSLGRPEYLKDTDVLFSRFQRGEVYGSWEQYLGMEHVDNSAPTKAHTTQNKHQFEKPIKIFN